MQDNIKLAAAAALGSIEQVEDLTNDDALKGMILATLYVAKTLGVVKESFFAGIEKAWDITPDFGAESEEAA